jgi:phospholipase/carboxylesterase
VPTETDAELLTFKGWTLRVRPSESASPRALILIHGWTGDENSMWVFTRNLSRDYWMIAPRAPHPGDPGGFSWRPAEQGTFGQPSLEMLKPAAEALIQLIDEYSASVQLDATSFDIMGFSQGAAMVSVVGMLHPRRVGKMAVLAGFVPLGLEDIAGQKPLAGKHVFMAHGTQDQIVAVDRGRSSARLLEQAGAKVTFCEDEVGHKLSMRCLRSLEDYLKD